jgi:hypothetical protein
LLAASPSSFGAAAAKKIRRRKKNLLVNAKTMDLALHTVDSGTDSAPDGWAQNPMYKAQDRAPRQKDSVADEAPEGGAEKINAQTNDKEDDAPEEPAIKLRNINISFEPTSVA